MTMSNEPFRRIDPTGHRVMQSGSMQARQLVGTRYLSNRKPSRTNRVTPSSWVARQAWTHSSQHVHLSRSINSRFCPCTNSCVEKIVERHHLHAVHHLRVDLPAAACGFLDLLGHAGKSAQHLMKVFRFDPHELYIVHRRTGSGTIAGLLAIFDDLKRGIPDHKTLARRDEKRGARLHSIGNRILAVRELFDPSLASLDLNLKMLAGNSFIPRNR